MQFFLAILFERFKLLNNFLFNFIAKNNKNRKETIDALCVVAALLVDIYNLSRLVSLLYLSKIWLPRLFNSRSRILVANMELVDQYS